MALEDFARQVANEPDGEWNGYLSGFWPIDAVIMCAFQAETLDQRQADRLWDMEWTDDFAAFVAPGDELITNAAAMVDLPAGYFLAFIEVDQPPSHGTLGRRHLLHAMISLGDGFAVGCRNSLVGLPSNGDAWQVVNLARHLNWLPPGVTNGYDVINAMTVTIAKSRPIRLRCRPAAETRGVATGRTTRVGVWGNPEPSSALADRIVAAAVATLQGSRIDPGHANADSRRNDPIFRPTFTFRIDLDDYELFFNSPQGLRGHYYASAEQGNRYTADLLAQIVAAVDWSPWQEMAAAAFTEADPLEALRASFLRGKIWTAEDFDRILSTEWDLSASTDRHPVTIPPNRRWSKESEQNQRNWHAFVAETGLRAFQPPSGFSRAQVETALSKRFNFAHPDQGFPPPGGVARSGAEYHYTAGNAAGAASGVAPNIDVKGGWTRRDGSDGDFTPPNKFFRGQQIKWFGFT